MKWDHVIEGFAQQVKELGFTLTDRLKSVEDPSVIFISVVQGLGMTLKAPNLVLYIFPYKPNVNSSGFGFSF